MCVCGGGGDSDPLRDPSVEILLLKSISTPVYLFISNAQQQHDVAMLLIGPDTIDLNYRFETVVLTTLKSQSGCHRITYWA